MGKMLSDTHMDKFMGLLYLSDMRNNNVTYVFLSDMRNNNVTYVTGQDVYILV